jgi:hypothetical protein
MFRATVAGPASSSGHTVFSLSDSHIAFRCVNMPI